MAIGLRGAGALATTTTNSLTFTLPAGTAAGDLIVVHIGAGEDVPEPAYVSGMTGYALRGNKLFLDYGPGGVTQWIYWKVAGASEPNPSITINDGGGGLWGYAMAFTGVNQSDPFDLAAVSQNVESSSSATFTPPSVQTQTDGSWVLSMVQTSDDNTTAMLSGSEQGFTHIASGASYETTVGLDASFASAYRLISTAGTVTLPTWQQVNRSPDYWAWQTMALKAAGAVSVVSGSFTANATVKRTQSGSLTANATVRRTQSGSLTANATVKRTYAPTFTASADVFRTMAGSGTANADVFRTQASAFTADAERARTEERTFTADADRFATVEGSFAADADRFATVAGALTADAISFLTVETSFTADAWVPAEVTTVEDSFTADAMVPVVGACVWTYPANGAGTSANPELRFTMPSSVGPLFFWLELDTADTFDTGNLRAYKTHLDQTGWSYWDGGGWQPVPAGGVPAAYGGNEARLIVPDAIASGVWYRRVRAGRV
jgi:hypothetical protein